MKEIINNCMKFLTNEYVMNRALEYIPNFTNPKQTSSIIDLCTQGLLNFGIDLLEIKIWFNKFSEFCENTNPNIKSSAFKYMCTLKM